METMSFEEARSRGLRFFFTGKPCPLGHMGRWRVKDNSCVKCNRKAVKDRWRDGNREKHNSWGQRNPDKRKASQERYILRHPERRKAAALAWWRKQDKEKWRIYRSTLNRRLRQTSINYRFKTALRSRIRRALRRDLGVKAGITTAQLIGCTIAELKNHLENQFTHGMTWFNYGHGTGKWNVDHIKPCAAFDLSDREQQLLCFHFSNLQPLWHDMNVAKGCRYVE